MGRVPHQWLHHRLAIYRSLASLCRTEMVHYLGRPTECLANHEEKDTCETTPPSWPPKKKDISRDPEHVLGKMLLKLTCMSSHNTNS